MEEMSEFFCTLEMNLVRFLDRLCVNVKVAVAQLCLSLCNPKDYKVHGISRPEYWSEELFLLQGIFPTQRLNPGLTHCRWILYQLSHQGNWMASSWRKVESEVTEDIWTEEIIFLKCDKLY